MFVHSDAMRAVEGMDESLGLVIRLAKVEIDTKIWREKLNVVDDRYIIRWSGPSCDSDFVMFKEVEDPPEEGEKEEGGE